jgi:hypothetical protein
VRWSALVADCIFWLYILTVYLGGGAGGGGGGGRRAKPAVPIGGGYRLIDVPMSNCINSGNVYNKIKLYSGHIYNPILGTTRSKLTGSIYDPSLRVASSHDRYYSTAPVGYRTLELAAWHVYSLAVGIKKIYLLTYTTNLLTQTTNLLTRTSNLLTQTTNLLEVKKIYVLTLRTNLQTGMLTVYSLMTVGIKKIYVLTQFNSRTLNRHLTNAYDLTSQPGSNGFCEVNVHWMFPNVH